MTREGPFSNIKSFSQLESARTRGYVPQSSTSSLSTTVFDTVLMDRRPHITWKVSDKEISNVAGTQELLILMRITEYIYEERRSAPQFTNLLYSAYHLSLLQHHLFPNE
jgi:iron complex transport system ATP-binding protein